MKKSMLILSICLLLFGCRSVPKAHEKITLNGMVYDTENRPAVNYNIYINDDFASISDIGGRFSIKALKHGTYKISGYGEGYLKIEEEIQVYDKNQIVYIRIPTIDSKFREAFTLLKENKIEKATKIINEIIESNPDNFEALFFLSVINYLDNKYECSVEYLKQLEAKGEKSFYVEELQKFINN